MCRISNGSRVVGLLLSLAVASGCNRGGSSTGSTEGTTPAASGASERLTIAVIPKSTGGEFWETVEQGARDAAKEMDVEIKWEGPLAETELAEQNKIIENMVNLG